MLRDQEMNCDALGHRGLFAVIGPATNTIVQPDFDDLRPRGITNHYRPITNSNQNAISDEMFMAGTKQIATLVLDAINVARACDPDYLVMGMSAITFYGGAEKAAAWQAEMEERAERPLCVGSQSIAKAIEAYGGIKKVALLSPYFPVANTEVKNYLSDFGIETVRDTCLQCPSWTAIAQVPEATLRDELARLDGDDVDAIIQVGTNLSMIRLAAAAERYLGKPIIAINTATYWNALRSFGITDKVEGFGRLLERH